MKLLEENHHTPSGESQGGFAAFVDDCRSGSIADGPRKFERLRYVNHSDDRSLPLANCELADSELRGMHIVSDWREVRLSRCDLAHTRGKAIWTRVSMTHTSLHHLMAEVHATSCTFKRCDFKRSFLWSPVFLDCHFVHCNFLGAVFKSPRFVNCRFSEVNLDKTHWEGPLHLEITGTWSGEANPESTSDAHKVFNPGGKPYA